MNPDKRTDNNLEYDSLQDVLREMEANTEQKREEAIKEDIYYLGDLKEKGFKTDGTGVYAPYKHPYYLKLSRDDEKTFSYAFYEEIEENSFKQLSPSYTKQKPIIKLDKDRNKIIGEYIKSLNLPRAEKTVKDWLNELESTIVQANGLDILKNEHFYIDYPENEEEEEVYETTSTPQTSTDYPENIQKMSMEIIKNGNLLDRIRDTTSYRLEGNKEEVDLNNYSMGGLFCGGGVNELIGGGTGKGKTKTMMECVKNYPDKYIYEMNTSPKFVYRDSENLQGKKIIIANDIPLTEANINLLKTFTRKEDKKIYKTLEGDKGGKQKKITLELTGDYVVLMTYAQNTPDEELANPFYQMSITPSDEEEAKIKEKIAEQSLINGLQHEGYSIANEINKCCIQMLIEQDFTVFNPYTLFLNPHELNNRDIDNLLSYVTGVTFFNYTERRTIDLKGKKIAIGSYNDFKEILDIWSKNREVQKYKLDSIQDEVLQLLPVMTREEAEAEAETITEEINSCESRNAKLRIIDDKQANGSIKAMSIKDLTRETEKGNKTIKRATVYEDKGSNKPCLSSLGLIDYYDLDVDSVYPQKMLYRVCDDDENVSNSSLTLGHLGQNENDQDIDTLNQKRSILISLLTRTNILINKYIEGVLSTYCESYSDIHSYDELVDFIQEFITRYDDELNFINSETISLEDLDFHNKITKSRGGTLFNTFFPNPVQVTKTKENSLNEEQTRTSLAKSYLTSKSKTKIEKEAISENDQIQQTKEKPLNDDFIRSKSGKSYLTSKSNIKSQIEEVLKDNGIDVDVGCKIIMAVSEKDLTEPEIRRSIYQNPNPDDYDEALILKINNNLERLVKSKFVEKKFTSGTVYCLTDKTKEILRG